MKLKRVKPILVETNEPTNIFKDHSGLFHSNLNLQTGHSINSSVIGYKLIIISLEYEKIEVGDTLLLDNEEIVTCIGFDSNPDIIKINCRFERYVHKSHFKKVIATQDQISPEYIARFIEQYNNGKVDDVEIEMQEWNKAKMPKDFLKYKVSSNPISGMKHQGLCTITSIKPC